jgi:DNA-binding GntR family transcriptional regulator
MKIDCAKGVILLADTSFDNRNLNEKVYIYLRNKIIHNELPPGTRIHYDELIEELGVSKTPLRDALNRLQQDGLIEIRPRSGTFVKVPNAKDIEDMFEVRKALERQAVALAMKHMKKEDIFQLYEQLNNVEQAIAKRQFHIFFSSDRNLHQTIIDCSRNQRLSQIMYSLEAQIAWIAVITAKNHERPHLANEMHKQILKAMLDGKVELAQHLMEEHIEQVKNSALSDFS